MRRFLFLLLLVVVGIWPRLAQGAGVVGTGTAGSCTEASLDAALQGGGAVAFNCGPDALIPIAGTKTIVDDTIIEGEGRITISGENAARVFLVEPDARLDLDGISIILGYSDFASGGAIRNLGTLTLRDCTLSMNSSRGYGGAVVNEGDCTVIDSTLSDNQAGIDGGGIANFRTLTTRGSTFFQNVAGTEGFGGGGGIANFGNLDLANSTFSRNVSIGDFGGAIDNENVARIVNCTLTRNEADQVHCGGIYNQYDLTVKNTLTALNVGGGCCGGNGITPDSRNNLTDDVFVGCDRGFRSVAAADLRLRGLADNGGPTLTIALLPESIAIDAGDAEACADAATVNSVDQRGERRFAPGDSKCSIGAFEDPFVFPPPPTPTPAMTFLSANAAAGNFIVPEGHLLLTPSNAVFSARHFFGRVLVNIQGGNPGDFWTLVFSAPEGRELTIGDYDGSRSHLDFSGQGRGCGYSTGYFTVRQAVYAVDGTVENFACDFEHFCQGSGPVLHGNFRLSSNLPTASPNTPPPTRTATMTSGPRTPTPLRSPVVPLCYGDCDRDGTITLGEVVSGVAIALSRGSIGECMPLDANHDGRIAIDELVITVLGNLNGCRS